MWYPKSRWENMQDSKAFVFGFLFSALIFTLFPTVWTHNHGPHTEFKVPALKGQTGEWANCLWPEMGCLLTPELCPPSVWFTVQRENSRSPEVVSKTQSSPTPGPLTSLLLTLNLHPPSSALFFVNTQKVMNSAPPLKNPFWHLPSNHSLHNYFCSPHLLNPYFV